MTPTMLESVEELTRDALFRVTSFIEDEEVAGLCFGLGLVLTDHVFNVVRHLGLR